MDYFTFLGTGGPKGYNEVCYEYENDYVTTKYVQQIILRSFKDQINRIIVFCTAESRSRHADELHAVLQEEKPGVNVLFVPISENISSTDFVQNLIEMTESNEIIIDITHIFRHIPMKLLFMIKYIEKSRNITVAHLFYGKYLGEEAHLLDFIDDYHVQELTEALNLFDKTLYLSPEIVEKFVDKDNRIEQLLKTMSSLNVHLETCNYDDTFAACKKILEQCRAIRKHADQYPVLMPFIEMIADKFSVIDTNNKYIAGVNMVQLLLNNHKLQTAITFADNLLRLSLIDKSVKNPGAILYGNNPTIIYRYSQELLHGANGYHCMSGNKSPRLDFSDIVLNQKLINYLNNNSKITYFYDEIRNKVNHASKVDKAAAENATLGITDVIEDMENLIRR